MSPDFVPYAIFSARLIFCSRDPGVWSIFPSNHFFTPSLALGQVIRVLCEVIEAAKPKTKNIIAQTERVLFHD